MEDDKTRLAPGVPDADATRIAELGPTGATRPEDPTVLTVPGTDAADVDELPAGALIKQRFEIVERLGAGGMGTVYCALDQRRAELQDSQPYVALKFLNAELRRQPEALVALQREAKKAQRLAHPNIVTVHDFDRDGARVYLSMELLTGDTLDRVIARSAGGGMAVQRGLALIERVARGLAYAHARGIVHADLKPGNIFVTADGQVKILDFGIARAVGPVDEVPADLTYFDASTLGAITPAYASPQMLAEQDPIAADDVYSLGCVAYELLAGRHPFTDAGGTKADAARAAREGLRVARIPGVPHRVMALLRRCLARDRARRPADAGRFIDMIRPRPRRRLLTAVTAASLAAAAAGAWVAVEQSGVAARVSDLPASLRPVAESLRLADRLLEQGRIDQAQNIYAQAWERAHHMDEVPQRDLFRLKVLVDRRMDRIAARLLERAERPDLGEFELLQLQLALEYLRRGELGSSDDALTAGLRRIDSRLEGLRQQARSGPTD